MAGLSAACVPGCPDQMRCMSLSDESKADLIFACEAGSPDF